MTHPNRLLHAQVSIGRLLEFESCLGGAGVPVSDTSRASRGNSWSLQAATSIRRSATCDQVLSAGAVPSDPNTRSERWGNRALDFKGREKPIKHSGDLKVPRMPWAHERGYPNKSLADQTHFPEGSEPLLLVEVAQSCSCFSHCCVLVDLAQPTDCCRF